MFLLLLLLDRLARQETVGWDRLNKMGTVLFMYVLVTVQRESALDPCNARWQQSNRFDDERRKKE